MEDHDLTALRLGTEPRGQLVHQHPVPALQGVLHRVGRDRERLDQEGLDQQGQQQGDADEERKLLPERAVRGRRGTVLVGLALDCIVRPLLALVASGTCAYRHIPHIHSSLAIAARPKQARALPSLNEREFPKARETEDTLCERDAPTAPTPSASFTPCLIGHHAEGRGLFQSLPVPERPGDHHGFAHDPVLVDGAFEGLVEVEA